MFAMHGSIYLSLKTDGELQARLERATPILMVAFFLLNTLVVIAMVLFQQQITDRYTSSLWPVVFPAAALVALVVAWRLLRAGRRFLAFMASSAMIALLLVSGAVGIYPNLLISTTDPAFNLTIFNAASADNTLQVALVIALIGMPFVLLYTAGVYYIFRGKTVVESEGY
jgi:cytochrome d ubiquinol oxidase subunit II